MKHLELRVGPMDEIVLQAALSEYIDRRERTLKSAPRGRSGAERAARLATSIEYAERLLEQIVPQLTRDQPVVELTRGGP